MFEFDYSQTRDCNESMSRNEVVQVLQGELSLLRRELQRRDEIVSGLMELIILKDGDKECLPPSQAGQQRCQSRLCAVRVIYEANQKIHKALHPDEGVTNSESVEFDLVTSQIKLDVVKLTGNFGE